MILPDFVVPSRINQRWDYSGLDSEEHCRDLKHFKSYPYVVEYKYNERGFRDQPWPDSLNELKKCIWCVGDSFTVGLGSPWEHTWPWLLQQRTQIRTINVSLDGASNNWIARKSIKILQEIVPKILVIQWSYINRRELDYDFILDREWYKFYHNIKDSSWPDCDRKNRDSLPSYIIDEIASVHGGWSEFFVDDEQRRIVASACTNEEDIENTLSCIALVDQANVDTKLIHSFIPGFVPNKFKGVIESKISNLHVPEIKVLDWARDRHHYDICTSNHFIDQVMQLIN